MIVYGDGLDNVNSIVSAVLVVVVVLLLLLMALLSVHICLWFPFAVAVVVHLTATRVAFRLSTGLCVRTV